GPYFRGPYPMELQMTYFPQNTPTRPCAIRIGFALSPSVEGHSSWRISYATHEFRISRRSADSPPVLRRRGGLFSTPSMDRCAARNGFFRPDLRGSGCPRTGPSLSALDDLRHSPEHSK